MSTLEVEKVYNLELPATPTGTLHQLVRLHLDGTVFTLTRVLVVVGLVGRLKRGQDLL